MGRWFTQRQSLPTSWVILIGLALALKYGSAYFFETPATWGAIEVPHILVIGVVITIGHLVRAGKS